MKNLRVQLQPCDLNFNDAAATLQKFQTIKGRRQHVTYPTIELFDEGGTWAAISAGSDLGHTDCTQDAHHAPRTIWIATAIPELSSSGALMQFNTSPSLFHPVPTTRKVYSVERRLLKDYEVALIETVAEKFQKQGKKFSRNGMKNWAQKTARRKTNFMLKEIYDRGDRRVMKVLYRYPFDYRRPIYDAVCVHGDYAFQLTETFPLLAVMLWADPRARDSNLRDELEDMVISGAKLKEIAKHAEIPWSLRRLPPQLTNRCRSVHIVGEVWKKFCPQKLDVARACIHMTTAVYMIPWGNTRFDSPLEVRLIPGGHGVPTLGTTKESIDMRGMPFILWSAQHLEECMCLIKTRQYESVSHHFQDLADWASDTEWRNPWHSKITFVKAIEYSEQWHREIHERREEERAAEQRRRETERLAGGVQPKLKKAKEIYVFPDPWLKEWGPVVHSDDIYYRIIPLDKGYKISEEGRRMRNCVGSYRKDVQHGFCYIFSVRVGETRLKSVATIQLKKIEGHEKYDYYIVQARAKCNGSLTPEVEAVVKKWCEANRIARKIDDTREKVAARQMDRDTEFITDCSMTGIAANGTAWDTYNTASTTTLNYNMIIGALTWNTSATTIDTSYV